MCYQIIHSFIYSSLITYSSSNKVIHNFKRLKNSKQSFIFMNILYNNFLTAKNFNQKSINIDNLEWLNSISNFYQWLILLYKGSVWLDMVVELRMQFCREIFRIHLRTMRRFYGTYLFRKSPKSIFEILISTDHFGGMILRIGFKKNTITTTNILQ